MIYLDNAATTPVSRPVIEAMWPYMTEVFGNAASTHEIGEMAATGLQIAREKVATIFKRGAGEIIFTSGGTESDNLAIKGIALANPRGRHIVTSPIEHEAVLESCKYLERFHDFEISFVGLNEEGLVDINQLESLLQTDTTLCTIQYANNEIGTVQDLAAIATVVHNFGTLLHVDAVQAPGLLPMNIPADAISIAGHKFGGPKGTGVLAISPQVVLEPLVHGGGQERGMRSGTSNVAGAVGLATALEMAETARPNNVARIGELRDQLIKAVEQMGGLLSGSKTQRLANHASFCFPGIFGETVLLELQNLGVIASSGSACAAGREDTSHVLKAIGVSEDLARTAIRFTLSNQTSKDDVETAIAAIPKALEAARD